MGTGPTTSTVVVYNRGSRGVINPMRPLLFLALPLVSCTVVAEEEEDTTPRCDGVLQADEGNVIDSTFDVDGDGFKDINVTECLDVYDPAQLDCNDGDPNIKPDASEIQCNDIDDDCNSATSDSFDNDGDGITTCFDCDDTDERVWPGNVEVCWDEVDNDCDNIIDNDCGEDYNGSFAISPAPSYTCSLGFVDISFAQMNVIFNPPYMSMVSVGGIQPGTMDGTVDPSGYFYFEQIIDIGTNFDCDEEYRLFGTFTDGDNFTATLQANYTGVCLNCTFMEFQFTGTRIDGTP